MFYMFRGLWFWRLLVFYHRFLGALSVCRPRRKRISSRISSILLATGNCWQLLATAGNWTHRHRYDCLIRLQIGTVHECGVDTTTEIVTVKQTSQSTLDKQSDDWNVCTFSGVNGNAKQVLAILRLIEFYSWSLGQWPLYVNVTR